MSLVTLVPRALLKWRQERTLLMGAALAFYIVLSLTPILVVAIGIASLLFEQATVQSNLLEQVEILAGADAAAGIRFLVENIRRSDTQELIPTVIGIGVLIWGASNVFIQIQSTLNIIFHVDRRRKYSVPLLTSLERYSLSILMLAGVAMLLIFSIVSETAYSSLYAALINDLNWQIDANLWRLLKFLVTFVFTILLFSLIYQGLPDRKVRYVSALQGALIAAMLYALGIVALGVYFSSNVVASTYGAASSIVVVLLWLYFASQVFLFGAQVVAADTDLDVKEGVAYA